MKSSPTFKVRLLLMLLTLGLLVVAWLKYPPLTRGQSARSWSRPDQEHLTFWVNHNGLEQLDVEGEVGFGDMARILLRRRANAETIRGLRDRFTFRVKEMTALRTPDVFRAEVSEDGLVWRNAPRQFVLAAGHTFNLPLIVENLKKQSIRVEARFIGNSMASAFPPSEVKAKSAAGYFLRVVESKPGLTKGQLLLSAGEQEVQTDIVFDVRPPVNLRVRLLDEKGRPTAARLYLTGSDGLAYAPPGSISRITAMSAEYYFHADGSFEIELPSGPTLIEATRGPEYELTSRQINLQPGQEKEVQIRLKRWENMAAKGWYSADAHIHANYTAPHHQVISPEDVRLTALAEDLNNANMMVANSGGAFIHDIQYFEGKPHRLSSPNFIIYWNEEMRNRGMYGHMSFFNLKSLVHPIYTGFGDTPHWEDYPPNYAQAKAARGQDGAVTYVHPARAPSFEAASAKELPVDVALGQVDAIDVVSNTNEMASMELWYRLLNCGFRLAISAGTDSFTNVADHYTPGGGRVYVHVEDQMEYSEWTRNYRRGRTFASNGPVIFFTLNDKEPGDELRLPASSPQKVRVKAIVRTQVPLEKVEIVANGQAVISRSAMGKKTLTIEEEIALSRSSWVAVRALGPRHRLILNDEQAFAHTSPVYVYLGEQKIVSPSDVRFYRDWIERLIARVAERGRFTTKERKKEVISLFQRALDVYQQIGSEENK
ncbi:CehA/McbA family metallohydrolase [Acidobacteria bacterium AH-259-G07]|nr:CehA/McbA family metallohydrolase [Acidobacteria bacterium AH-259-G07]